MSPNIILGKTYFHNTEINSEKFCILWNTICHKIEFIYVLLLIQYFLYFLRILQLCYFSAIKDYVTKGTFKMWLYNLWRNKDCFIIFLPLLKTLIDWVAMGIYMSKTSYARGILSLQWFSIWYLQWGSFARSDEYVVVSKSTSGPCVTAYLRKSISLTCFKCLCNILSAITPAIYFRVNRMTKTITFQSKKCNHQSHGILRRYT